MSLIGRRCTCPACCGALPDGSPTAVIRLAKNGRPFFDCQACGFRVFGNRPQHIAGLLAFSSLIEDNPEVRAAVTQRIGAIYRATSGFEGLSFKGAAPVTE